MKINIASVFVDDQAKALRFYTEVLGFRKKTDVPMGGDVSWLTVVSPEQPDGTQLLLEPSGHRAVGPFKEALVADGIPGPPSPSTTSTPSSGGCRGSACASSRSRPRWARSPPPSWTTPAAT